MALYNKNTLLQDCSKGDEKAFTELFRQNKDRLFHFLMRFTQSPEEAEDIVQEVFMTLWTNREKLPEVENLNAYMFTICRNKVINIIKRKAKEGVIIRALQTQQVELEQNDTAEHLHYKEAKKKISLAFEHLPRQQKTAFYLSRQNELKHEEIASLMQISKNTVRNHIVQVIKTLKKSLATMMVSFY